MASTNPTHTHTQKALDFRSPTGLPQDPTVPDGGSSGATEAGLLFALVVVRFVTSGEAWSSLSVRATRETRRREPALP